MPVSISTVWSPVSARYVLLNGICTCSVWCSSRICGVLSACASVDQVPAGYHPWLVLRVRHCAWLASNVEERWAIYMRFIATATLSTGGWPDRSA
ncbi:hypothetical protein C8Q77DRAFT_699785 [Trametes polyzona]|nr:hypothetical protein C8Q77DRAFT_699785 [Trametes polyzona]